MWELRSCFEFIAQSTHENGYIKPRKTFWRNSKQLLTLEGLFPLYFNVCLSVCFSEIIRIFAFVKKTAIEYGNL